MCVFVCLLVARAHLHGADIITMCFLFLVRECDNARDSDLFERSSLRGPEKMIIGIFDGGHRRPTFCRLAREIDEKIHLF